MFAARRERSRSDDLEDGMDPKQAGFVVGLKNGKGFWEDVMVVEQLHTKCRALATRESRQNAARTNFPTLAHVVILPIHALSIALFVMLLCRETLSANGCQGPILQWGWCWSAFVCFRHFFNTSGDGNFSRFARAFCCLRRRGLQWGSRHCCLRRRELQWGSSHAPMRVRLWEFVSGELLSVFGLWLGLHLVDADATQVVPCQASSPWFFRATHMFMIFVLFSLAFDFLFKSSALHAYAHLV